MASVKGSRMCFFSSIVLFSVVWISTDPSRYSPVRLSPTPYRDVKNNYSARNYTTYLDNHGVADKYSVSETFEGNAALDKSVRMCGWKHCFDVFLSIDSSGNLHTDITSVSRSTGSNTILNSTDVAYFDMLIEGPKSVYAKLVTDRNDVFNALSKYIPLYSNGSYSVSLTLQYLTTNSAFGFSNPQPPQLNCVLKTPNNKSHLEIVKKIHRQIDESNQHGWRRYAPVEFNDTTNLTPILDVGEASVYFKQPVGYKQYFVCPLCATTENLYQCAENKRVILLGDSHIRLIWMSLQQQIPNINASIYSWRFLEHGPGIYRNRATMGKEAFEKYINGSIPASFFPGPMLGNLRMGSYKKLHEQYHFGTWVVSSGHWDLRDDTVENYTTHLEELLNEWAQFQRNHSVRVVWNGIPSFSYKPTTFGGLERRTNVKIAVADSRTKLLAAKYNITYVPFFDLSYPFYSYSCDTHHYLCPGQSSPIGSAQLNTLLNTIC